MLILEKWTFFSDFSKILDAKRFHFIKMNLIVCRIRDTYGPVGIRFLKMLTSFELRSPRKGSESSFYNGSVGTVSKSITSEQETST